MLRRRKSIKSISYVSPVHGIVHTASWPNNDVGDRLWLRSDQPIIKGRRSVPVVNLDKGVSGEVWYVFFCGFFFPSFFLLSLFPHEKERRKAGGTDENDNNSISHVTWHPQKRELSSSSSSSINTTITFIGAEYRHSPAQRRGNGGGSFRMCVTQEGGNGGGIIEMITLEELETCFEDVKPLSLPLHQPLSLPQPQQPPPSSLPRQDSIHNCGPFDPNLTERPRILGEDNEPTDNDDNDDNTSQASFASSSSLSSGKGKLAQDLVALSLSIFNFNAAMLDLAALSNSQNNQSMGTGPRMGMSGLVGDVSESPEAEEEEDDSDDEEGEDGEEGEEKVWSDCESVQSSVGRQSVMGDGDESEEGERSQPGRAGMGLGI